MFEWNGALWTLMWASILFPSLLCRYHFFCKGFIINLAKLTIKTLVHKWQPHRDKVIFVVFWGTDSYVQSIKCAQNSYGFTFDCSFILWFILLKKCKKLKFGHVSCSECSHQENAICLLVQLLRLTRSYIILGSGQDKRNWLCLKWMSNVPYIMGL